MPSNASTAPPNSSTANFKVHYNRGKNHLLCGRTEQAVADFDKAVSLKPEHAKAHELFGDALSRCGKEEEAAIHWAIAETLREKAQGSLILVNKESVCAHK